MLHPGAGTDRRRHLRDVVVVIEVDAQLRRGAAAAGRWGGPPHHRRHHRDFHEDRHEALPQEDRGRKRDDAARDDAAARDDVADLGLQRTRGGHLQRRRSAQALGPDAADAEDACRGQRAIVDGRNPPRDLAGQHRAERKAEAPVEPRAHHREEGHGDHRRFRRLWPPGDGADETPHRRGAGQHVARDDDQRHLHGERDELPEAPSPRIDHARHRGRRRHDRGADDEEGREQREDEGVRHPALGPLGERQGESRQHADSHDLRLSRSACDFNGSINTSCANGAARRQARTQSPVETSLAGGDGQACAARLR